jgi:hypothetical protein
VTFQLQTDKKPFQLHLIHIGMNPLTGDASTRRQGRSRVHQARLSRCGSRRLGSTRTNRDSGVALNPNYVLNSSPEKHQVVWTVDGMSLHEAEGRLGFVRLGDERQMDTMFKRRPSCWPKHGGH